MGDVTDFSIFGKNKKKNDELDRHAVPEQGILEKPKTMVKTPIPASSDHYKTDNSRMGTALIFNHKTISGLSPRQGTEKDRDRMAKILKIYGFDVKIYNDLSYSEVLKTLTDAAKEDHSDNDCFVVTIMSHGIPGKVYAKDMAYPVEHLWVPFLGNKCESLVNKPKLFFIQACRGDKLDEGVQFQSLARSLNTDEGETQVTYTIPTTADLLVMYSTFEGNYSWRNPSNGSWFIQTLCQELEADTNNEDGVELFYTLTAVARKVAYQYQSNVPNDYIMDQMKQMPSFVSTLTKIFRLKKKKN